MYENDNGKRGASSRRHFLKAGTLAGVGMLGLSDAGFAGAEPAPTAAGAMKISDLDLKKLHARYKEALFGKFLPNMDRYVIDHDLGGFMCSLDTLEKKLLNTNKRAWFEGRGIWTYSYLYNNFGRDPKHLEIARKSKDFVLKLLPADGQFYPTTFSKEGRPVDGPGDIYGNLFVAEGLAEYSRAAGQPEYLEQAKQIMFRAVERYDQPDFKYAYRAEQRLAGPRILGHWMILLSICTQMLRHGDDERVKAIANRCVDAILNHHMDKESLVLKEALAHDLSPLADPVADNFGDIGHGSETLAFTMNYALLQNDAELFRRAAKAFKFHVDLARDRVYGGHFHMLDNIETNTFTLTKTRWLQEEILNGALVLIEHTGDEWALRCFAETEEYIRSNFVRPEYAFVIDTADRKADKHPHTRAEHYHHPRQLMVGMLAFERILKRREEPTFIFGKEFNTK